MTVVAIRIPLQVILVIVLGDPETRRRNDLRRDRTRPLFLGPLFRPLRGLTLFLVVIKNRRPVLGAAIVPLLILRRRIVQSEKVVENLVVADLRRIELDLDRFGVTGVPLLHILVPRILESPARVT